MHKKVLAAYEKAGMELPLESANDVNIKTFYEKVKMSGKPIRREITSIYRMKVGNREVFWYHQELRGSDGLGNELEVFFPSIGKYNMPEFDYVVDAATGARFAESIKSQETKYELEWPKDWNEELEKDITDKVQMTIITANNKHYGGYTWEQFKSESFDDLLMISKYGTKTPTPKIIEIEDNKRAEKDKEKRARLYK